MHPILSVWPELDKHPNTGFDADFDVVESSFTMECSAAGIPFNCDADLVLNGPPNAPCSATIPSVTLAASVTSDLQSDITLALGGGQGVATSSAVTADGERNYGGVAGEIPTGETGQPPVQTADGAGNLGGAVGEIPACEAGQELVTTSTTDSIAQTTEQAAPGSGQASINDGDQGAVIVSINPGGADGNLEAVSIASLTSGAGAKAKARRGADRAAILRQRAGLDTTSTDQPAITPAPKYNPRGKRQHKSSQNAAPIFKRDRRQSLKSIEKRAEELHNWCQESQVVVSEHDSHSAVQVRESESSWVPDFVSIVEGVYCDMCKRQYYPLCDGKKMGTACFDLGKRQLSGPARWWRSDDWVGPVKRYDNVRYWI